MKNLWTRAALFIASLCAGSTFIRYFGSFYVNGVDGFLRGNRRRVLSILKLEWLMLHIDLIIYLHLFSIFNLPHFIFKFSDGSKSSSARLKLLRFRCFCVYLIEIFFAHLHYFLYMFESVTVPWLLYDIAGILNGIWLHLAAFAVFFVGMNVTLDQLLARSEQARRFFEDYLFRRFTSLRLFCRVPQFQVLLTLVVSFVFCLSHWYLCDKIYMRQMSISLHNNNAGKHIRVAVITDLHGGASVYRKQIEHVVDAVNTLDGLDVVLIIGDAVDAPRSLIEDRMQPLKFLRSRLGTYFVTGNHEYYYGNVDEWIDLFKSYGITTLRNQAISLNDICFVGLDDISSYNNGITGHSMDVSAISKCPAKKPIVVMAHNPAATKEILQYSEKVSTHVDLILSGHTHASQYYVMAPYIYWILPYFYGIYHVDASLALSEESRTMLLVSAGTLYQGGPMKMPFMSQIWLLDLEY